MSGPTDSRAAELRRRLEERLKSLSPEERARLTTPVAVGVATGSPIGRRPDRTRAPATFAQELIWQLHQAHPSLTAYHVPRFFRIRGPFDRAAFQQALDALAERHEMLRTTFAQRGDVVEQLIQAPAAVPCRFQTVTDLPAAQREARAQELVRSEIRKPFDLTRDRLLRALVIELGSEDHVVTIVSHHLASDGASARVLFRDLGALYEQYAHGTPADLPALPVQFGDYAAWERAQVSSAKVGADLAYWRAKLGDVEPMELATDRPRPTTQSFDGDGRHRVLPAELADRFRVVAQEERVTLFLAMMAAWATVLARYTGQHDVVLGAPSAGRSHPETEELIGYLGRTMVLRVECEGDPTFAELLGRVRQTFLEADEHQAVPFEQLAIELQKGRPSHTPLFQVLFSQYNPESTAPVFGTTAITGFGVRRGWTKFDLSFGFDIRPAGIGLHIDYRTDLFDPGTIDRMLEHVEALVAGAVADRHRKISRIPLLAAAERDTVLRQWNQTAAPARAGTLPDWIRATAAANPDRVAIQAGPRSLSYEDLENASNRLARHLAARGVAAGDAVAVSLDRTADLPVALLAVQKLRAAYVPLDPGHPADRLKYILEDAGVSAVITERAARDSVLAATAPVIVLDEAGPAIAAESSLPIGAAGLGSDLAYIIYTSGSTGRPKGVEIPQSALVNFLAAMAERPGFGPDDVMLALTTVSFDIAGLELWLPLVTGGRVVIAPKEAAVDGTQLMHLVAGSGATHVQATPTTWRLLLEAGWHGDGRLTVLCGGEAIPSALVDAVAPQCRAFWNMYGPTETTIWSAARPLRPGEPVTIGGPILNTQLYVLSPGLEPQPIGVPGELCIGGAGLARGYRGRPDLTAERFVADPFGKPDQRIYRTGDRVRWRPDGTLEFLGRMDNQIKLRGFRIELGEIEEVLARAPGVKAGAVLVREDVPGDPRLVGYVVLAPHGSVEAVDAHLRSALPGYMVPAQLMALDAFPLTPNGKLDRKALPAPAAAPRAPSDPPRSPLEQAIADLMAAQLGLPAFGRDDDFFRQGGHSLVAMRLLGRLRAAVAPDLTIKALFDHPTPAQLAAAVAGQTSSASQQQRTIPRRDDPSRAPLSFAQELLWIQSEIGHGRAAYNVPMVRRVTGAIDYPSFQRALDLVVERHEALRTVIALENGVAVQRVLPARPVEWIVDDLRDERDAEAVALERAREVAGREFALDRHQLLRAYAWRIADDRHVLALVTHHVAVDGWSMGIILHDLALAYDAVREARAPDWTPFTIQFGDFAAWQRQELQGEALDRHLGYWTRQLADAPPVIDLPTDRPRGQSLVGPGAELVRTLPPELLARLKRLATDQGATLYMVLMAAWQILLRRYSGQADIVVGSPVAGRPTPETEGLVGDFVNTVLVRGRFEDDPDFTTHLARVRTTCLEAFAHDVLPLEKLAEALRRQQGSAPQFQVLFVMQGAVTPGRRFTGLRLEGASAHVGTAKVELSLSVTDLDANGLRARMEYRSDLFDESTVSRLLEHYEILLGGLVENPEVRASAVGIISPAERHQVLFDWNSATLPFPQDAALPDLVSAQAGRTPDQVAVTDSTRSLTYRELERRADLLAGELAWLGIGPGAMVAICAERSVSLVVGLLGILKAGAAYVPLDPAYPADRNRFILEDCGATVLVTEDAVRPALPPTLAAIVSLDRDWDAPPGPAFLAPSRATASDLAYLIYTSGSTGRPKGCLIQHRNAVSFVAWAQSVFTPEDFSGTLAATSVCFDLSVFEIFATLASGGRIIMVPNALHLTTLGPEAGVRLVNTVPSVLEEVLRTGPMPSSVKLVCLAGEPLSQRFVDQLYELPHVERVFDLYGPSEDTTYSTYTLRQPGGRATIGRPIANTQAYVLDPSRQPTPIGVPGELFLAGAGVAAGYLNRPDLTAERFLDDPFRPGQRMYRTGDKVRYLANGELEYQGRLDTQIKLRGFRIELGEIEATLARQPGITGVAAVVQRPAGEPPRLVAFVTASRAIDEAEARAAMRTTLPDYMVPTAIVRLDQLPLTPNGKADRRALEATAIGPRTGGGAASADVVYQQSATLANVAVLWERLLGRTGIEPDDDFFDIGGHSLLAIRMIQEIKQAFGVSLPIATLYQATTVRSLSRAIHSWDGTAELPTLIPIQPNGDRPPLFCVSKPNVNALGYVFLARHLGPDQPVYGLQTQMRDSSVLPYTYQEYKDKAAEYIAAMRERQPAGPYLLAGQCEGAHIAFEMARQLEQAGERVEILTSLDAWPLEHTINPYLLKVVGWSRAARNFAKTGRRTRDRIQEKAFAVVAEQASGDARTDLPGNAPLAAPEVDRELHHRLMRERLFPGRGWQPRTWNGRMLLFRIKTQPYYRINAWDFNWSKRATQGVDVVVVPGEHAQMLRPPAVGVIAAELRARIDRLAKP